MKKVILLSSIAATFTMASSDGIAVESKAGTLKFSGEHRLTYTNTDGDNDFSVDRTYLQVKAYFFDNPKSYARITMDVKEDDGTYDAYLKYGYLYLNDILPHTGVEIGQVHKPWVDYEEHYGFPMQAVYGVYTDKLHITNSADRGLNFKTKLDNFSSEIGVFQGEGYKDTPDYANDGFSFDARLTYHVFGRRDKANYLNISLAGATNTKHRDLGNGDYGDMNWGLAHAVYRNSDLLIAAQYLDIFKDDTVDGDNKGDGYSLNAQYFFAKQISAFARYDYFQRDRDDYEKKNTIGGIAYKYNKYVTFALSGLKLEKTGSDDANKFQALVWVKW